MWASRDGRARLRRNADAVVRRLVRSPRREQPMSTQRWRERAVLGLAFLVLLATAGGCRGMLPAPSVGVATPAQRTAVPETRAPGEVVVYLVTSDEQARLLR